MWRSLLGTVELEIRSADIARMLSELAKWNITLLDIQYRDDLTVILQVSRIDYKRSLIPLQKCGCSVSIKGRNGIYWKLKSFLKRPVLTFGVLLYLFLVVTVPNRVYFIQVEGNHTVPERLILEAAQQCGIGFGANRREVRSERMKNALLEKIPLLQWAGINTQGCVAIISVRERPVDGKDIPKPVGSIVASRDAIIRQITVLRGTQLCKVGQAVKAGDILVSAYKDYGISLKLTGAQAEIFGQTEHNLSVVTPAFAHQRTVETGRERKYSVLIGKKQINFFKDSGISHTSCVKMYKKTYVTLPGGHILPIAIVTQELIHYKTESCKISEFSYLESYARDYLISQMISGRILQKKDQFSVSEDRCSYSVSYSCYELIGVTKDEEFISKDE